MNKFLINIPNDERTDGRTADSIKYNKDCDDFVCMNDGTITRECRYCELSTVCRQVDILPNGETVPMEGHKLAVYDPKTGENYLEIFCTGMYDLRPLKERIEDDKVS